MCNTYISWIISGVAALGSIVVAFLAIWGRTVRSWIYKPSLSLEIDAKDDCCVDLVETQSNDSSIDSELQIRVKLSNEGNETAVDTIAIVEDVYKQDGDGKFLRYKKFIPHQLMYHQTGKTKLHIIPKLSYYIEVAKVKCWQSNTMSKDSGVTKNNYKLYLQIDEKRVHKTELGVGTFIVPIKTYYRCAKKPTITYVWLHWNSDDLTKDTKQGFVAQIKTEKEFNKLVKK